MDVAREDLDEWLTQGRVVGRGQFRGRLVEVTWSDGHITADADVLEALREAERRNRDKPIGHPLGPWSRRDHLRASDGFCVMCHQALTDWEMLVVEQPPLWPPGEEPGPEAVF
ncbi:MAG: hypothetical protein AB7S38_18340 [Vulcanimicrobiota bacterium]